MLPSCKIPHISCTPTLWFTFYNGHHGDDPNLQPSNIILGHLPPADMLFSNHYSAFPMATLPSTEQLTNFSQSKNCATILEIYFITICQDLSTDHLQHIDIPDGNSQYSLVKSHFIPIPTNTYIYSIDFLPDHEYQLFRVVKTINVTTPQCILPQTREPYNVLIYQATSLHFWISNWNAYYKGRSTHLPFHQWFMQPTHHFQPWNDLVKPYTSTTVQHLFKTQACIPINTIFFDANPWIYPKNPSQLWHQSSPVHHVVDDLANRLIQVITTKQGSNSFNCAWA